MRNSVTKNDQKIEPDPVLKSSVTPIDQARNRNGYKVLTTNDNPSFVAMQLAQPAVGLGKILVQVGAAVEQPACYQLESVN